MLLSFVFVHVQWRGRSNYKFICLLNPFLPFARQRQIKKPVNTFFCTCAYVSIYDFLRVVWGILGVCNSNSYNWGRANLKNANEPGYTTQWRKFSALKSINYALRLLCACVKRASTEFKLLPEIKIHSMLSLDAKNLHFEGLSLWAWKMGLIVKFGPNREIWTQPWKMVLFPIFHATVNYGHEIYFPHKILPFEKGPNFMTIIYGGIKNQRKVENKN